MAGTWKNLDLRGAGLQAVNLHLARRLKRPRRAYLLWVLFPLGAHRIYLHEPVGATLYGALSATTLVLSLALASLLALIPALAMACLAIYDLYWIDRRLPEVNKRIRMEVYLQSGTEAAPPPGFRGRYPDDEGHLEDYLRVKEAERAGVQPPGSDPTPSRRRAPSFAQQEAMLRELAKARRDESARREARVRKKEGDAGG
jgi:TM2 domain-containing membrane protein YozV